MEIHLNLSNLIVYEEDNEYVLIDMIKNKFYSLDFIGSIVWSLLSKGEKFENVVTYLVKNSGMEYSEIREDVIKLIYEMGKKGLLSIEE